MNLLKAMLCMAAIIGFFWLMVQAGKVWRELLGDYSIYVFIFVVGTLVLWLGQKP